MENEHHFAQEAGFRAITADGQSLLGHFRPALAAIDEALMAIGRSGNSHGFVKPNTSFMAEIMEC